MSRNYTTQVRKSYSAGDPTTTIEFQAGSLNAGVISVEVPGRGAPGYGQAFATTISKILSHGSANPIPTNPLVGEMWFNPSAHLMMMYVGSGATQATSTQYPGWMFLPASSSSEKDQTLADLGAVNKNGDTIEFLTIKQYLDSKGTARFCGVVDFHEPVFFRGPLSHDGLTHSGAVVEFGANVSTTATTALTVNGTAAFNKNVTLGASANLTVGGTATVTGATTIGGTVTLNGTLNANGAINMISKSIKSSGKILVDNTAADPAILEIGDNGILNIKGKIIITGDLVSSSGMQISVDAAVKPVATGTIPVMSKTLNRLIPNTAVSNNTGKVKMPSGDPGLMLMVANDTSYDVTITRANTVDTVNGVVEDIVIGPGARMQFIIYASTSTKVDWILMNSFYG